MTTVTYREADRQPKRQGGSHAPWPGVLIVSAIVLLAAITRLWNIETAYELFIDEVTYTHIARSLAAGEGVALHGEQFHLHPPGLFGVLAMVILAFDLQGHSLAEAAYTLRPVPALFGVLTPAFVALIVRWVTRSWPLAAVGGVLLAVDPFVIRFDTRVLLEAQAMAFAMAGLLILVVLQAWDERGKAVTGPAVLAGLMMLGSLLTKETYAFVAVLPVMILLGTGWALRRRITGIVLASTTVGYLAYVAAIITVGQFDNWFDQKTRGVERLLGVLHLTGFNQEGSPNFVDRLLVNLSNFGVTYTLIGLGAVANVWLLVRLVRGQTVPGSSRPAVRLLVVWALCSQAHLLYAITLGTLEEQMFYLLVVTVVPVLCIAARAALALAASTRPAAVRRRSLETLRGVLVAALVAALAVNAGVWWHLHETPDNGYARLLAWAEAELPPGSRIAAGDEVTQFILDDVTVSRLETGAEVREFRAHYVLIARELLAQGYSSADEDLLQMVADSELVFIAETRTLGRLEVYDVSEFTQ